MNSIQRKYRISERKFNATDIEVNALESSAMMLSKDKLKEYESLLLKANIPFDKSIGKWISVVSQVLNLFNAMDKLDSRPSQIYTKKNGNHIMKSTPMNDGTHKISIHYKQEDGEELYTATDLGNNELGYLYQMAYDIYSGCPRFEWDIDIESHVRNAISIINAAKDGVVFRRDIFTCESYGITFVPIDVINLKVTIDKKIQDIPFVTGCIIKLNIDGTASCRPYSIKVSLSKPSKQYLNEKVMIPGEMIDLKDANNLFIQLIKDKAASVDNTSPMNAVEIIRPSLDVLTHAKARHKTSHDVIDDLGMFTFTRYDHDTNYIDDDRRDDARQIEILPQLLKPTGFRIGIKKHLQQMKG